MSDVCCVFGKTGSGKTTSFGEAAKYLYSKTGKPGRAIYSDPGQWKPIKGVADAGIIEPYLIIDEPNMPVLLHKLSRGFWPEKLVGGIRTQGTKMLAPTAGSLDGIGFYIFEGLTSASELLMKYLRDKQVNIGGDPVGKFNVVEDGVTTLFCANNMKHYNWVQDEMLVMLAEYGALPVDKVLVSAHETLGSDTDSEGGSKDPIRGAALVGKAGTAKVGKNVGDYIHYETFAKSTPGGVIETTIKAYYKPHPDPKFPNISYDCKPRLPLSEIAAVDKQFPGGFFDPRDLGKYLEACDNAVRSDTDRMLLWKQDVDAKRLVKG